MSFQIGIDVGGTFTDLALLDSERGTFRLGKVLTSSDDPSRAVLAGFNDLLREAGISAQAVSELIHATTIATNTVIQRKGAPTALLTTAGFRDILIVGRQKRWDLYDNAIVRPRPIVLRRHVWEVPERVLHDGTVHVPLDKKAVRRIASDMIEEGIQAVAICFLHGYAHPQHEREAAAILQEEAPNLLVSLSSDVCPLYREYERANTTAVNAYLMPGVSIYIRRLEQGIKQRSDARLLIMQSNGGLASLEIAERYPVRILESGPAAGVLTAARFAADAGTANLLSFDMGGTTAKVCLIEEGRAALAGQFEFDRIRLKANSGMPIMIPTIDLVEIGAGGGSLAHLEMGAIAVGPESAGSDPGPICYGRGGHCPTVTDADLVLGYLDPSYFLGGQMALDLAGARDGIETHIARPLGTDLMMAAYGIYEVVNQRMADAARAVSIGRGKDPRDFALVAFGGAGPMHGARLAQMLGCRRVVFPSGAGVMSAIGLLMADPAFDMARTQLIRLSPDKLAHIDEIFRLLEEEGRRQLAVHGLAAEPEVTRSCDMRFAGQGSEISVALPPGPYEGRDPGMLARCFFDAYKSTYSDRALDRTEAIEGVHWRLSMRLRRPDLAIASLEHGDGDPERALKGERLVYFAEAGGFVRCPVYERCALRAGDEIMGPAIVEERESTVVLVPNSRAAVSTLGSIVVDMGAIDE